MAEYRHGLDRIGEKIEANASKGRIPLAGFCI